MCLRCWGWIRPPIRKRRWTARCKYSWAGRRDQPRWRRSKNNSIIRRFCRPSWTIRESKWIWEWSPGWCWALRNFKDVKVREVAMSYKCCEGVRGLNVSRRYFLKQGGVAMVGLSAMPAFLQRAVAATPMPNKKQLVVLFQRGAADGLNIVVPFRESNYYRIRPSIAIPHPNRGAPASGVVLA